MITDAQRVMSWLQAGVPITLLADLADPRGPKSREIHAVESFGSDVAAVPPPRQATARTAVSKAV